MSNVRMSVNANIARRVLRLAVFVYMEESSCHYLDKCDLIIKDYLENIKPFVAQIEPFVSRDKIFMGTVGRGRGVSRDAARLPCTEKNRKKGLTT